MRAFRVNHSCDLFTAWFRCDLLVIGLIGSKVVLNCYANRNIKWYKLLWRGFQQYRIKLHLHLPFNLPTQFLGEFFLKIHTQEYKSVCVYIYFSCYKLWIYIRTDVSYDIYAWIHRHIIIIYINYSTICNSKILEAT